MKILILEIIRAPNGYGSLIHRLELVRSLSQLGNEVHVLVFPNLQENLYGAHKHFLKDRPFFILFPSYIFEILTIYLRNPIDIIMYRNSLLGILAIIIGSFKKSCLFYEENGIRSDEIIIQNQYCIEFISKFIANAFDRIDIFVAKKSSIIRAITPGIKDHLIKNSIDNNKIFIVGNGANTVLFHPINDSTILKELRDRWSVSPNEILITFVGNLAPWQGVDNLINGATMILNRYNNVRFMIVGDGPMRRDLESLTEKLRLTNRIIFTGSVPYEQVPLYINISDICVAPFIHNRNYKIGLSALKIYEYLACAKPVIASNIPGIGDLLKESMGGITVKPESPSDLADSILKLIVNESLRLEMGKNGYEFINQNCSWNRRAEEISNICKSYLCRQNNEGK